MFMPWPEELLRYHVTTEFAADGSDSGRLLPPDMRAICCFIKATSAGLYVSLRPVPFMAKTFAGVYVSLCPVVAALASGYMC